MPTTSTSDALQGPAPKLAHYQRALDQLRQGGPLSPALIDSAASCLTSALVRDTIIVLMTGVDLSERANGSEGKLPDALVAEAMARILDPVRGQHPGTDVEFHVALLRGIIARLSPTQCAPAHTLLALIAWWNGDEPTAICHVEEALTAEPTYRLAHLLACAFATAMLPGWATTNH